MGNIGWTGIIIIAILVVILFGEGKISSIMGDLAKGIKSFKKGMSDDNPQELTTPTIIQITQILIQITQILKTSNLLCLKWLVRDISNSNYCDISFGTKRISDSIKKIGSYFGRLKNTISNFQREVNSATENIDFRKDVENQEEKKKK